MPLILPSDEETIEDDVTPSRFPYYLSLENYRAFRKCENIPIKPITLIYGENSSGKSSLVDAYLHFLKFNADRYPQAHLPDKWITYPKYFERFNDLSFRGSMGSASISVTKEARASKHFHGSDQITSKYSVTYIDYNSGEDGLGDFNNFHYFLKTILVILFNF